MGAYDEALAKSLEMGNSRDLGHIGIYGDLIKAHVKAHFRMNAKTGRREFIKDYDDARDKDQVHVAFHKGHKVRVNNPKSKHQGKTMEVSGYSDKYDVVRGKIDGEKHAVDFHADHLEHHDEKGNVQVSWFKTDFEKMSDQQLFEYSNALTKWVSESRAKMTSDTEKAFNELMVKITKEVKRRKDKQDAAKGGSFKAGDVVAVKQSGVGWSDEPKQGMEKITYKIKQVNDVNVVMTDGYVVKKDRVRLVKDGKSPGKSASQSQFKLGDTVITPSGMERQVIKGAISRETGEEKVLVQDPRGPVWYEASRLKKKDQVQSKAAGPKNPGKLVKEYKGYHIQDYGNGKYAVFTDKGDGYAVKTASSVEEAEKFIDGHKKPQPGSAAAAHGTATTHIKANDKSAAPKGIGGHRGTLEGLKAGNQTEINGLKVERLGYDGPGGAPLFRIPGMMVGKANYTVDEILKEAGVKG